MVSLVKYANIELQLCMCNMLFICFVCIIRIVKHHNRGVNFYEIDANFNVAVNI